MPAPKDLTGQKINMLTLLKRKREDNRTFYYCKCDCGNEKWMRADRIKSGRSKSCGCYNDKKLKDRFIDLSGQKFNNLTVLSVCSKYPEAKFLCKCDCGNETIVRASKLKSGEIKSCGCLKSTISSSTMKKNWKNDKLSKSYLEGTKIELLNRNILNKNNTSGVTGVCYDNKRNKWLAQIAFKKKTYNLGLYEYKKDAINARKEAEEKFHKNFLREKGLLD